MSTEIMAPAMRDLQGYIEGEQFAGAVAAVLPEGITVRQIVRSAIIATNRNPALLECTRESLLRSILDAASLGLDCSGGTLGHGHLVPFNNKQRDGSYRKEVQFLPGYRGIIDLARRHGGLRSMRAEVVHEGDRFAYSLGLNPRLDHEPTLDPKARGRLVAAYAVAELANGDRQWTVMLADEVGRIKGRSKSAKNGGGPWDTDEAEMWKKTAVMRLRKMLPISAEPFHRALELAEADIETAAPVEAKLLPPADRKAALAADLGIATPPPPPAYTPEEVHRMATRLYNRACDLRGEDGGPALFADLIERAGGKPGATVERFEGVAPAICARAGEMLDKALILLEEVGQ